MEMRDTTYLEEEIQLVESRKIPLERLSDKIITECKYEELLSLNEELELLLFLLDLKRYCRVIRLDKIKNEERKIYRREIKKKYTKIKHLILRKEKELPVQVKILNEVFSASYSVQV